MTKIGAEEKRIDPNTESSFYPSMYKPRSRESEPEPKPGVNGTKAEALDPDVFTIHIPTPTDGLPDSSLFLPCHYFQYAGGTSTGG
jgi:hypothetical protein